MADSSQPHFKKRSYKRHDSRQHNLQKRPPQKLDRRDSVIYVSSKSNIKALLDKCDKLIKKDEKEIVIYCMGAAIQRGILLALQVCEQNVAFKIATNTSTVELVDDLEPTVDEADYEILKRSNSALQIKLCREGVTV
ncbi:ribonuclease P protein subunit p20 [Photinus pyralis]|uniref:ribonuclease P protein subunit p20 n=1 Tax=Photinus pyralis TaxID=7054 RepID=UPI001267211C|nr:ribonuclease P protein subunit p20 [Photinus pyralis]